jgi:hypothetical protein
MQLAGMNIIVSNANLKSRLALAYGDFCLFFVFCLTRAAYIIVTDGCRLFGIERCAWGGAGGRNEPSKRGRRNLSGALSKECQGEAARSTSCGGLSFVRGISVGQLIRCQ